MRGSTVGEALAAAADALAAAGVDDPRLDAEVLLAEASGMDRAGLAASPETTLPSGAARVYGQMVRRRTRREPVAYILGRKGFRLIEVAVDPRVLIPRPETELLVEIALDMSPHTVLDVGTGSGAVALAVASELPGTQVVATDTSAAALDVARANAERLGIGDRVRFELGTVASGEFDLTLANLPYVAEGDFAALAPEIARHEPREALLGGPDGLNAIRALVAAAGPGTLALEVGAGQAADVAALMTDAGFEDVVTRPDLAGIERVVIGQRQAAG